MKNLLFLMIGAIFVCSRAGAAESQMTKIVSRMIGPQIPPGSFAAKPKTLYLAGEKYARVEEQPDSEHGIHGLMITNEPDSWIINLADKTGRHIVDPGPTFVVHSPIFWIPKSKGQPDPDKEFKDLEFGKEVQFFHDHGARELETREVDGKNCKATSLKSGSQEVTLLLDSSTGKPYQIDIMKDGKLDFSVRYLSHETNLPFQRSLFEPPDGVRMTEASATKADSPGLTGRYNDLMAWVAQDNDNSQQFTRDLRDARSARDVALALKTSARRQQKTTDELIRVIEVHPELRNAPQLGLDSEGLGMWKQAHPDAKARLQSLPAEVLGISEQVHRFNSALGANGGTEAANVLRKYRDDPEVVSASKELSEVLAENRRKLIEVFR